MCQRLVLDERHHRRDRDAVVRTERRPVRPQPVAVAHKHDPPFGRVVRARRVTLADHVEMTLQDQRRRRLTAGRRGYRDDEVSPGVLPHVEAVPGSPGAHVLDDGLLLSRGARDRRQRLEVPPKRTRLEAADDGRVARHLSAPGSRLGERLLLDRVELGLRDRAAVEERLRLLDLGRGPAAAGRLTHVVVELLLLRAPAGVWRSVMPTFCVIR